jgi:acetyltransferase
MGVLNTSNGLYANFERDVMPERGGIALLSQSSSVGAAMLDWAKFHRIGVSKFACVGDRGDVDEADLISYLARDGRTNVICVYIKNVRDGRKFVESIQEAVKRKPVCILKADIVEEGEVRRGISRTASLAKQDEIFDAAFKQGGAIRVRDLEELFDVARAFVSQPPMEGNRVVILSNARGAATLAADATHREGLMLAELSNKATKEITKRYSGIEATNPVDVTAEAKGERYKFTLERILKDPNVDGVMVINMLKSRLLEPEDLGTIAKAAKKSKGKPVLDVAVGEGDHVLVREALKDTKIPTYDLPEKAARVLRALYQYGQVLEKVEE